MFHVLSVVLTLSFFLFMHIYITIEREREKAVQFFIWVKFMMR